MLKTEDGYIGYSGNYKEDPAAPYNFWILDDEMQIVKGFGEINPERKSRIDRSVTNLTLAPKGVNSIFDMAAYDIFHVEDNEVSVPYQFDFGKYALKTFTKAQMDNDDEWFDITTSFVTGLNRVQETKDHLWAFYLFNGQNVASVYDKTTHKCINVRLGAGINEVYPLGFGRLVGSTPEKFYTIQEAEGVYRLCRGHDEYNDFESEYPEQIARLRELAKPDYENHNPYICIYGI